MLGIKNYNPQFYISIKDLVDNNSTELHKLIGKRLIKLYSVHDSEDNELWRDCPIVFIIDNTQLELCVFNDREMAITYDYIDLNLELDWYGNKDLKLVWKQNSIETLNDYIGRTIIDIYIIEALSKIYNPVTNELISSEWLLNGIGFQFDDNFLSVYNAFDEIGFEYYKKEGNRYISLAK